LKASAQKIEGCQVELQIEVEPDEMEQAMAKAYRRVVNKVVVPGFRKGKAPRSMLEKHIGGNRWSAKRSISWCPNCTRKR